MNGSYLRMKSMVLGYTLPKNLMNKVAIDNLRVYISADNLFTITAKDFIGFDPQTRSTGMQSWHILYLEISCSVLILASKK